MAALDEEKTNLQLMAEVPGNICCADCKAPNPEWASINLGIMVCLECSGLHRQMGTHISKVRSLKLDAKCWVGALLAHMCSIGNTAFNAVWEANLPPDTMQPQFYPENSAVREAYIYAKYLHHAFFKNEAGGPPVPEERFPVGKAVEYEAMTTKLSGGKMFGGNKWDKRSLRLANSDLAYLDGGKEKGRFSVLGAAVELVPDEDYSGHPCCFSVKTAITGKGGKDDGRTYVFQTDSPRDAVKWVQLCRYALADGTSTPSPVTRQAMNDAVARLQARGVEPPPAQATFLAAPGVPYCGLGQVVDQLYAHAAQWVDTSTIKSSACMMLGLPNAYGVWHDRFLVLTPWCIFVYLSPGAWDAPVCALPLQAAELVDNPALLPTGKLPKPNESMQRTGVAYPLGFAALSFGTMEETTAWNDAIKTAIKTSQDAMGGAAH